jgi:hypothetical protein
MNEETKEYGKKVMMTYRELYDSLIEKYADEKGIIRGKPCSLIYRVSRAGEAAGFDSLIEDECVTTISCVELE